jgi:UDP-2,4-diacetamido-2,4,6-trideoxy-beta-L-altropyranose hydrolase
MRSLAEALDGRGVDVDVIGHGIGSKAVERTPWSATALEQPVTLESEDVARTSVVIGPRAPDVVIVDHYALGEEWERGIAERFSGVRIVAVDDLPGRTHAVDVLIDPNLGAPGPTAIAGSSPLVLAGTAFAPLDAEYRTPVRLTPSGPDSPNVLVTLGGGRSGNIARLAEALARTADLRHVGFEFVVPDPAEQAEVVRALGGRSGCSVHGRVATLRPFLQRADLVIGAGGTTTWQCLRLGRPSVLVSLAPNQVRTGRALSALGVARWVGEGGAATAVAAAVVRALDDDGLRRSAESYGPVLVDGRGAERIALALFPPSAPPTLRPVEDDDAAALLAMANDPLTRTNSREGRSIGPEEHLTWFRGVRDSGRATFWVAEVEGLVVGQVRFTELDDAWELSYGLDPIGRGRGWSTPMVEEGLRRLRMSGRAGNVFAVVHAANAASRHSLSALGFRPDEQGRARAAGARLPDGFAAYLLVEGSLPQ